jgi:glycosyltransferase involved in cell wall biosynthesis
MKELLGKEYQHVLFVIPDPESFPSGGNIYNLRLIDEMRDAGKAIFQISEAAKGNNELFEKTDHWLLDSLFLNASYQWFWEKYPEKEKMIIFHHLDCLELEDAGASKRCFGTYKRYFEQANSILVTSEFSRKWLCEHGINPEKVIVKTPQIGWEVSNSNAKTDNKFIGLMVANLIPRKGILPFLKSLSSALSVDLSFEMLIAGSPQLDPKYAQACKKEVKTSPFLSSRIKFLGEIPPAKMPELYERADVFISASSMETFGMALQEAKHFGVPILALGSETQGGNISSFFSTPNSGQLFQDMQNLALAFRDLVEVNN